jgi:hypothetical protein
MKTNVIGNVLAAVILTVLLTGCDIAPSSGSAGDTAKTLAVGNRMANTQATPTDLNYSLERYNLIRRAYWVNGQREKANALPCQVVRPFGYIVLVSGSGAIFGRFVVDGKVSSLQSYLTPDSEFYEKAMDTSLNDRNNRWIPDVDGTFGNNDDGIFFFTTDGNYVEWTGDYLYSDIPMEIKDPVIRFDSASAGLKRTFRSDESLEVDMHKEVK